MCVVQVYVFLGDEHALIDLVRYMHVKGLNNGDYLVVAVHGDPYDPHQQRYFNKCQLLVSLNSAYYYSITVLSYCFDQRRKSDHNNVKEFRKFKMADGFAPKLYGRRRYVICIVSDG